MPDSSKRGALLCKTEVTYATDSVPVAATNAVAVMNPQFTTDVTLVERDQILRDSISRLSVVIGRKLARLTYGVEMKGSGTAGTPPNYGPILKSCGLSETTVAVTSVTYTPVNTGFESCTIYWYDGSKLHKLTGVYSTMRIVEEVGQFGRFEVTSTGNLESADRCRAAGRDAHQCQAATLHQSGTDSRRLFASRRHAQYRSRRDHRRAARLQRARWTARPARHWASRQRLDRS